MKHLRSKQQGFTIIEVMIVLVIAAVILLIVFLAVPALQRNSRNTQIRSDVSNILGAVNEYSGNHNGRLPDGVCAGDDGVLRASDDGACNTETSAEIGKIRAGTTVSTGTEMPTDTNTVVVSLGEQCNDDKTGFGDSNSRSVAAGFLVETSNDPSPQCQES